MAHHLFDAIAVRFDAHGAADIKLLLGREVHLSVGAPRANIFVETVFLSTAANNRAEVVDQIDATLSGSTSTGRIRTR